MPIRALSSCSHHPVTGVGYARGYYGRSSKSSRRGSERRRFRDDVPCPPAPTHHCAIVRSRKRMAARPKLVADRTEDGTETRRVPQALEPLEHALAAADWLVRVLDPVVLTLAAKMGDGRHDDGFGCRVAR